MRFVVFGAGAVGCTVGGMLARSGADVLLVGRERLVEAVSRQGGLRIKSATSDFGVDVRVTASPAATDLAGDDVVVILTVKSYDTDRAVEALAAVAPPDVPVVSLQNGVENEERIAARFPRVYGGVCRMTCSMVKPGAVSFRRLGRIVVGRWPRGSDAVVRGVVSALEAAGFAAVRSRNVTADKWLKLAVNSQSVFNAVIDPRDHDANAFFELKARILEETRRVFRAAHVAARSCDGLDPSIDEMIAELRRPRAPRPGPAIKVGNSTWQDLYLRRGHLEAPYFHQPVIDLGREHGTPTPRHEVALELAQESLAAGAGPEGYRLADVLERVERREGAA